MNDLGYSVGEYLSVRLMGKDPPAGWRRRFLRFPIALCKWGLGGSLGSRILLVRTTGRKTGKPRITSIGYLHDEATDTFYLMAGWGGRTDWFRNLQADPRARIRVGTREFEGIAEFPPPEEAGAILRRYVESRPFMVRTLERDTGLPYDGSDECLRRMATRIGTAAVRPQRP